MSKKNFIALADTIREMRAVDPAYPRLIHRDEMLNKLAEFCRHQNPRFNRERWLGYIAGENGPNGGAVKKVA